MRMTEIEAALKKFEKAFPVIQAKLTSLNEENLRLKQQPGAASDDA